jgi:signal transduction histidine kinase
MMEGTEHAPLEHEPLEDSDRLRERIAVLERENASLARSLERAEARFHDLADNGRSVVSILDGTLKNQLYVSPGYEALWERSRESLYANPDSWLEAVHPEDAPRVRQALESPSTFNEEYRVVKSGGDPLWVRTRMTPVRNEACELLRVVAFTEDIGDWKRMETQLVQSQKMDAIGRLAGGIAHDFNNLLTVINGYSAMLLERLDLSEDVRTDLSSIRRSGERAAALTAQLLSFSRKGMAQPRVVDLSEAVTEILPMLRRLIREDVELVAALGEGALHVNVDPAQFEQVAMNLAINARDAIEGQGTITIETAHVEFDAETGRLHGNVPPGRYAMLAVSDTGKGMPAKVQERIFEPFFTTKELGQGTGLGLATVYGIVQQSGGSILVYSEESVGSTFRIYLPVASAMTELEERPAAEPMEDRPATILLVEDDLAVRTIARDVLQKRGYRVVQAVNGEEALALAEGAGPIDLLIADVIMPKLGGPELAAELAQRYPEMKVLFISGYTENAVRQLGKPVDDSVHLAKPFSPEMLARKVNRILSARSMTA